MLSGTPLGTGNGIYPVVLPQHASSDESGGALLGLVAARVESIQKEFDGSHDFAHILRVARVLETLIVSKSEKFSFSDEDLLVARLGCLLHDVDDHKYQAFPEKEGRAEQILREATSTFPSTVSDRVKDRVLFLIENVSWSKEQKVVNELGREHFESEVIQREPMLELVQDADRLDAIGALGIARCFAFGGSQKGRALYSEESLEFLELNLNSSKEKAGEMTDSLAHFFEKLFWLKGRLRGEEAKKLGDERHRVMEDFVAQMIAEVKGER